MVLKFWQKFCSLNVTFFSFWERVRGKRYLQNLNHQFSVVTKSFFSIFNCWLQENIKKPIKIDEIRAIKVYLLYARTNFLFLLSKHKTFRRPCDLCFFFPFDLHRFRFLFINFHILPLKFHKIIIILCPCF